MMDKEIYVQTQMLIRKPMRKFLRLSLILILQKKFGFQSLREGWKKVKL
jgi:hypothetical protein